MPAFHNRARCQRRTGRRHLDAQPRCTHRPFPRRAAFWLAAVALASAALPVEATEPRVMISGPSMGQSKEAIPNRLARGEKADVLIMVGYALDRPIKVR